LSGLRRITLLIILANTAVAQASANLAPREFMNILCGSWVGTGVAEGTKVSDTITILWSPDQSSLIAKSTPLSGDAFEAQTELRYDARTDTFHAIERNNGRWPLRKFVGKLFGEVLDLREDESDRKIQLRIELTGTNTILVRESTIEHGHLLPPFVEMKYTRKRECAA
jgi:hypothetical protein